MTSKLEELLLFLKLGQTDEESYSIEEKLRVTESVKLSHQQIFLSKNPFSRSMFTIL